MKASKPASICERQQKHSFRDVAQQTYLSLLLCTAQLSHQLDLLLKQHGTTQVQYNVLRILRGAGERGLGRNEIRDRLVNTMPDVTRLLDRMEKLGWIVRGRVGEDRRQVSTYLTKAGRELLDRLEEPVSGMHKNHVHGVPVQELRTLLDILEKLRANSQSPGSA